MTQKDLDILRAVLGGDAGAATDEWLDRMRREYPFFPLHDVAALRGEAGGSGVHRPDSTDRRAETIARIALALGGDGNGARNLAEGSTDEPLYAPDNAPTKPTTVNAIDTFLQTYGEEDDAEISTLEKLIFNPVADYSQQLAREAEALPPTPAADGDSQDDRINRFILSMQGEKAMETDTDTVPLEIPDPAPKPAPKEKKSSSASRHKAAPEPADNSLLSESLAKIYIKTKRYARAYEILSRLSLAFPEKNAYFADQLRFLRKLIVADRLRRQQNSVSNNNTKP